jgi:hypothetical protein
MAGLALGHLFSQTLAKESPAQLTEHPEEREQQPDAKKSGSEIVRQCVVVKNG